MSLLRFLINLVLAVILFLLAALIVVGVGMAIMSQTWERYGLDYGAEDASWVWLGERPIHVRTAGEPDSPPVVLLHGFQPEGMETWSQNIEALGNRQLYVIAIDLEGFGRSNRDLDVDCDLSDHAVLVATILNEMGIRDATVVGHGWGGAVALELLKEQPQFVGQLLLVSPRLGIDFPQWLEPALDVPVLGDTIVWTAYSGGPYAAIRARLGYLNRSQVDSAHHSAAKKVTQIAGTSPAMLRTLRPALHKDYASLLGAAQVPALVLYGEDDRFVDQALVDSVVEQMPDAAAVAIGDAGWYLQIEQSASVNRYISDFALSGIR